jgi:hypothetical protein
MMLQEYLISAALSSQILHGTAFPNDTADGSQQQQIKKAHNVLRDHRFILCA